MNRLRFNHISLIMMEQQKEKNRSSTGLPNPVCLLDAVADGY